MCPSCKRSKRWRTTALWWPCRITQWKTKRTLRPLSRWWRPRPASSTRSRLQSQQWTISERISWRWPKARKIGKSYLLPSCKCGREWWTCIAKWGTKAETKICWLLSWARESPPYLNSTIPWGSVHDVIDKVPQPREDDQQMVDPKQSYFVPKVLRGLVGVVVEDV